MRKYYVLSFILFALISKTIYADTCPETYHHSTFTRVYLFPEQKQIECVYAHGSEKTINGQYSPTSGPWVFDGGFDVYDCDTDHRGTADTCVFNPLKK